MRAVKYGWLVLLFCNVLLAQSSPVPLINQPLVPTAATPGSAGFNLTVNGTGFVSGSVVYWNGTARSTAFVSARQLTAVILSSDVAVAATASITVSNPGTSVTSNVVFFSVTPVRTAVSLSTTSLKASSGLNGVAVLDLNRDGILDLAVSNSASNTISILIGRGDGTFGSPIPYPTGSGPSQIVFGDFNGDGYLDLAATDSEQNAVSVLLGNGDGTLGPHIDYPVNGQDFTLVAGDLNHDGKLDLAVGYDANPGGASILLGNGDGTFQPYRDYPGSSTQVFSVAIGDFNEDGNLDLALANVGTSSVSLLFGNGDGTFQPSVDLTTGMSPVSAIAADFNSDGHLDLAISCDGSNSVSILLGNGDGTFRPQVSYTSMFPEALIAADLNGDGKLDLAVTDVESPISFAAVLLGNGDGTFQNAVYHSAGASTFFLGAGDFNNDGMVDLVSLGDTSTFSLISTLLQDNGTVVSLSPSDLKFGSQLVGTISSPKKVVLTNTGTSSIMISSITATSNFSQTSDCGKSLAAGAGCTISAYLTPGMEGPLTGYLSVADSGGGSPQLVTLSGTGTFVQLSRSSIKFGNEPVGSTTSPQRLTLTNRGTTSLTITRIGIEGLDGGDFAQINACGTGIAAGESCQIQVTFTPSALGLRNANLAITDNGGASPQRVALSGSGT